MVLFSSVAETPAGMLNSVLGTALLWRKDRLEPGQRRMIKTGKELNHEA